MQWNRREFVTASSLGLVSASGRPVAVRAGAGGAAARRPCPEFKDVRRNVGIFTARGGTIGYLVTPDAVIVIDSQFADTAPMFLEGLKPKTSRKIDLLINSHHHPDHTGGNKVMQPSVGEDRRARQRAGPAAEAGGDAEERGQPGYADTTFDKDWKTTVGKETVSARYYGPAHTGGDIVITFEQRQHRAHGRPDVVPAQPARRPARRAPRSRTGCRVLENIVKDHNNDTIYIFGHSKVGERVTGSGKDLLELRDYFTAMLDFTRRRRSPPGKSKDEIVKAAAIPGFERYEGTPHGAPGRLRRADGEGVGDNGCARVRTGAKGATGSAKSTACAAAPVAPFAPFDLSHSSHGSPRTF